MIPLSIAALVGLAGVGALLLTTSIVHYTVKHRRISNAVAQASPEQLEEIYKLVEQCGSLPCTGFVFGRTNLTVADPACVIEIPATLMAFPWAGQAVHVRALQTAEFSLVKSTGAGIRLLGRVYRAVAVPRVKLKSGKERNRFDPRFYLETSSELCQRLRDICPRYPDELLGYLLSESFRFEPINQGRIGTSPAWVQGSELQHCKQCRKPMALIVQIPGTLLNEKLLHNDTFYFFGCKSHPNETASVTQFT